MRRRRSGQRSDTDRIEVSDRIGPARLVGLIFVAIVALVFGWAIIKVLSPAGLQLGARSWGNSGADGVLLHADDRTLTVSFTGGDPTRSFDSPCWEGYEAIAQEDPTTVRLEVKRLNHAISTGDRACEKMGFSRSADVTLSQPLAGRTIVDAPTVAPVGPFLASSLLTFHPIPDGWSLIDSRGTPNSWTRTWANGPFVVGPGQPFPEMVSLSQKTAGTPSGTAPPGPPPIAVTVCGKAGTIDGGFMNRARRWDERGSMMTLFATHTGPAGVLAPSFSDEELLAVAEQLR